MTNAPYSISVIRTKLYRPPVTADCIYRTVLVDQLACGVDLPLTVLSAPAGYGKTTIVSQWLAAVEVPYTWLSLDESDNDIRVFLSYIIASMRTVASGFAEHVLDMLKSESLPPAPLIAVQLCNELEQLNRRVVLVLDDYHHIREETIHSFLEHLLAHPSPQVHLVILTRRDPPLSLATLRAHHLLTELRMQSLAFSSKETRAFLKQAANQDIPPAALARLQESSEGWPAALRLAALALREQQVLDAFLGDFPINARHLQSFMVSEVLSAQSASLRRCLLLSSILDRFSAPLCEALWQDEFTDDEAPANGGDFIQTIEKSGLFCVALDSQHTWFRYHHLFADLLRNQLEATQGEQAIRGLHHKASRWFAGHGYFEEAIQHALRSDDEDGAAAVVDHARHELMKSDQWHRLERWLKLFSPEAVLHSPQLMVLHCWLDMSHWYRIKGLARDLDLAQALLDNADTRPGANGGLQQEISVMRSALAYWTLQPGATLALTEPALLERCREREYVQSIALMYQIVGSQMLGEVSRAERLAREYLGEHGIVGPGSHALVLQGLCFIYWSSADIRKLQQTASRMLALSREHSLSWSHSFARYFLGLSYFERNELDEAAEHFAVVVDDPYRYPIQNVAHCSFMLSLTLQARGEAERANDVASALGAFTLEHGHGQFIELAEALQAELDWRQGRQASASQWATNFIAPPPHPFHRYYNAEFTPVRVFLAQDTVESRQLAASWLDSLHGLVQRTHHHRFLIDVLAMQAVLADRQGDGETAVELLRRAVEFAVPGQVIRPLVDLGPAIVRLLNQLDLDREGLQYAGRILDALRGDERATTHPAVAQALPDPLSPRELEILSLYAGDLSNREIAERLFISTGTVKRHSHNIYGKLAVGSRREAVTKATALGLLDSG